MKFKVGNRVVDNNPNTMYVITEIIGTTYTYDVYRKGVGSWDIDTSCTSTMERIHFESLDTRLLTPLEELL